MRVLSLTVKGVLVLLVLLAVLITVRGLMDARIPYDVSTDGVNIPQFTVVEIPFDQTNDFSVDTSLAPFGWAHVPLSAR